MANILTDTQEIVMKPKEVIFRRKAEHVVENLKKRNISALYCTTSRDAISEIRKMIPEGSTVALGGSVSVIQSGLLDTLRTMKIKLLDRYREGITNDEVEEILKQGVSADVLVTSSGAVTAEGKLVNEDGRGNRVAGMIFGPKKVIFMVGMNKVVATVDEGLSRIKNVAAPLNCIRLGIDTPCARTGFCDDASCHAPQRICSQIVIIESNRVKDRLTVVLVGQELGY
ncbi:MAG: lactate utilization protein [Ignavibacteria bacterium]|nr:lactate utilization protein [Ignavibacteria bacterium]